VVVSDWLLNKVRNAIVDSSLTIGSAPSHISIGTGSAGESGTDTELQTEIKRKAIEFIDDTSDRSIGMYITFDTTEGNDTIREFGVHDAASAGNMHLREALYSPYTKTSASEMRLIVSVDLESMTV
jgi:hypothetical protein